MGEKGNKKRDKQAKNSASSQKTAANPIASETIALLQRLQVSPHYKTSPSQRRRLENALSSAYYIPNCMDFQQSKKTGTKTPVGSNPRIVLFKGGSLEAAEWASQHLTSRQPQQQNLPDQWFKPVVLDFASDSCPGGGWRGKQQGTQEEAICRLSSLGLSLEHLSTSSFSIPSAGCVYVPDVVVMRQSKAEWKETSFWCAVIAAALRNSDNSEWILSKVRGIINVASGNGHGALVGGAWGCGAFGNDAETLANAWRIAAKAISDQELALIVLALPSQETFSIFQSTIPGATVATF